MSRMSRELFEEIFVDSGLVAKLENKDYAQNVYAALCKPWVYQNSPARPSVKLIVSFSWRTAADIVARLRDEFYNTGEDYLHFYCSGVVVSSDMFLPDQFSEEQVEEMRRNQRYFCPEESVTDEVAEDLASIGLLSEYVDGADEDFESIVPEPSRYLEDDQCCDYYNLQQDDDEDELV